MPETQDIVINTSPVIALVAALGDLSVLQMYRNVWVPLEGGQRGWPAITPTSSLEPATDLSADYTDRGSE